MEHPKAVFFDFDGTLAEMNIPFAVVRKAVLACFSKYAHDCECSSVHLLETIQEGKELLMRGDPAIGAAFEREALAIVRDAEIRAAKGGALFAGSRQLLSRLKEMEIATGILTRNCKTAVEIVFPDVCNYVNILLTRDDTAKVKPDPEHLVLALRVLDVHPSQAVVVGDHPIDIFLGRRVGTVTVGVLTGSSTYGELRAAGAHFVIERADLLINLINGGELCRRSDI